MKRLLALCLILFSGAASAHAEPFEFRDGDRVVLLGSTLIERDQSYGYLEAALTARFPDKNITFRNLGWSGDTVWGEARAGFDTVADGFRRLKELVFAEKPTVILVGYGTNESFAGEADLPKFVAGFNTLLDTVSETGARIVLLSPLKQEDLGRPLPNPAQQNKNIELYSDAIREIAADRGLSFVNLAGTVSADAVGSAEPLTDNGLHLTSTGYRHLAAAIERGLELPPLPSSMHVTADGQLKAAEGTQVTGITANAGTLLFEVKDNNLPGPITSNDPKNNFDRRVRISGLPAGQFSLWIDGDVVATADSQTWADGVSLASDPASEQSEQLRSVINLKNELYFHRWRPQNETYLLGFRKHEQGQNAVEIAQFDPLVDEQEKIIAQLRLPRKHTYELKPDSEARK